MTSDRAGLLFRRRLPDDRQKVLERLPVGGAQVVIDPLAKHERRLDQLRARAEVAV